MQLNDELNISLIHDWFSGEFKGGAEKVFNNNNSINRNSGNYALST